MDPLTQCAICLSNPDSYLFIECGHGLCYECLQPFYTSGRSLQCHICRCPVTKRPLLIQSMASTFPDGINAENKLFLDQRYQTAVQQPLITYHRDGYSHYHHPHSGPSSPNNRIVQPQPQPQPHQTIGQLEDRAKYEYEDRIAVINRFTELNELYSFLSNIDVPIAGLNETLRYYFNPITITFKCLVHKARSNVTKQHQRLYLEPVKVIGNAHVNTQIMYDSTYLTQIKTYDNLITSYVGEYMSDMKIRTGITMIVPNSHTVGVYSGDYQFVNDRFIATVTIASAGIWNQGTKHGSRWHIIKTIM